MQNSSDVLSLLEGAGLSLSISRPGELMVVPRELITHQLQALIMNRKADILESLAVRDGADILQGIPQQKAPEGAEAGRKAEAGKKEARGREVLLGAPPAALSWLHEYRARLKAAGWTGRELYRRNKSKGILWMSLWNRSDLQVSIMPDGVIEFWFMEHGSAIRQTARPIKTN
ncbi:MAG: hypothetical protein ACWGKN_09450 [Desulfoprunum sp.]